MPSKLSLFGRLARSIAAASVLWAVMAPPVLAQTPEGMLVRVEQVRVQPMSQTVPIVGRLVSMRMGDIAARIDGPVEAIRAEVGDRVGQGQVLAVLDAETLQADLNLAQSELREAEAELNTWRAETDVAETELRRQEGLRTSSAFSQARHEDAQKRVAVAETRVERARANVSIKRSNLERKQIDVENAVVRAPYAGVVMRRYTEAGAYIKKGDPVVRVIGDQALEVEAYVPNSRLGGLPVGRTVEIRLDDGTSHKATVRSILPSENPQTRTRVVRLVPEFTDTVRPLADSQSVVVSVPVSDDRRVVTVHKDAILKRPNGDIVYVVNDGSAHLRPVSLGEAIGGRFEVVQGLKEGEIVVTRGNERLQPGAKVRVEKDSS